MKAIVFLFLLLNSMGLAQNEHSKRDQQWLLGYGHITETDEWQDSVTQIDFSQQPPVFSFNERFYRFRFTEAMLCTEDGKVDIYSNACTIYNSQHELLVNGDRMPPDAWVYDNYCPDGYPMLNNALLLPDPADDQFYHYVTAGIREPHFTDTMLWSFGFYHSLIDRYAFDGRGAVLNKNKLIVADTLFIGHLTACRHANGRDWWILVNKAFSNQYYTLLLSPGSLRVHHIQQSGPDFNMIGFAGQGVFSPNGERYARYNEMSNLVLFDFDRCSGTLSSPIHIPIEDTSDTSRAVGVAFSPNSRFLYVPSTKAIYQFDTYQEDIAASKVVVGEWEFFLVQNFWPTFFNNAMLAPDGKIYVSCLSSNPYMHVIHHPNRPGLACDFRQRDILLPTWSDGALPNYPHFRLGALPGSPCDTIYRLSEKAEATTFDIYPNPLSNYLTIQTSFFPHDTELVLYNAIGQRVLRLSLPCCNAEHSFELPNLPNAVYFYSIFQKEGGKVLQSGKLIKQQ